jgi:hypothetical protein
VVRDSRAFADIPVRRYSDAAPLTTRGRHSAEYRIVSGLLTGGAVVPLGGLDFADLGALIELSWCWSLEFVGQ